MTSASPEAWSDHLEAALHPEPWGPLSPLEYQRLSAFKAQYVLEAILEARDVVDPHTFARRLIFTRWLRETGRISDHHRGPTP